jgi:transcriptional regulator of arginine metabolism
MKRQRHKAILDLVRSGEIASQEDLMQGLKARHIDVSQSTLSRDIQELGLAKAGGVYAVVESESSGAA